MLFMCNNNASNTPRPAVNDALNNYNPNGELSSVIRSYSRCEGDHHALSR